MIEATTILPQRAESFVTQVTGMDPWIMVGRDGIEPSTNWLKASCSTAELTAQMTKNDALSAI